MTLLFLCCLFILVNHGNATNKDIDDYIHGLQYSEDEVLAFKGDSIDTLTSKEKMVDDNKCVIIIKREKKTASNRKTDIGVVSSNEHIIFPGALLLANKKLMENNPTQVVLSRAKLAYTVNLPGLSHEGNFFINPTFSYYQANKEKILNRWFDRTAAGTKQGVNANYQSESAFAYSKEYLMVRFGLEFSTLVIASGIEFEAMEKEEKLIMIHQFKQIFYTVSVEAVQNPSDLFAPEVTVDDVKRKVDEDKPPVIVDSVSYGRTIYVKLETSSTDKEVKNILKGKKSFVFSSENESVLQKTLKDVQMQVLVLGGSTDQAQMIETTSFKEVNKILADYSTFSRTNPGYPVSYSTQFVKDHTRATVSMSTDYIDTSRTTRCKGTIKIIHKGLFVMKWEITWKEVTYDENGNEIVTEGKWHKNGKLLTAPFEEEFEVPGNAEDIHVVAMEVTALAWDWWRSVIDKSEIPLIAHREFSVWGTSWDPHHNIDPPLEPTGSKDIKVKPDTNL